MPPSSCQGGFCSLVLPHDGDSTTTSSSYISVFDKQHANSLSKGEKRLKKSRQRDRAIRLLRWVLTDDEYSILEESGDLVTLRVVGHADNEKRDLVDRNEGYRVDEASIMMARREHRPELARLAFAEFQSALMSGDNGGSNKNNSCDLDGDCAGGGCAANALVPPPFCSIAARNEGAFALVCGVCYNVYGLLQQARVLLKKSQQRDDQEGKDEISTGAALDRETRTSSSSDIVSTHQQQETSPKRKFGSDRRRSSQKDDSTKTFVQSSINPSRDDDRDGSSPKPKKKKKKRSKRRKRNRRQIEENSKVHILVAEADEVRD